VSTPPHAICETPAVLPGPWLLEGISAGPRIEAHRARFGGVPTPSLDELLSVVESVGLRGRGGAAFPFATKLRATAAAAGRPVVVVNL
jgi:NADH:ubiquinone oxidoreductase subunit F (NADH-binding)